MWVLAVLYGGLDGDKDDEVWYNNYLAAGSQIHPTGLFQFYDMFSVNGWSKFFSQALWEWFCDLFNPTTIFPYITDLLCIFETGKEDMLLLDKNSLQMIMMIFLPS